MADGWWGDGEDADHYRLPPPPDDRLWRHPSEQAFAARASAPRRPARPPRVWPVAATAVALGGFLAGSVLQVADRYNPSPAATMALTRTDEGTAVDPTTGRVLVETPDGARVALGFVIRSDGLVVTAPHVIDGGTSVSVVMPDGRRVPATVVGTDAETGVAVVKADVDRPTPTIPAEVTTGTLLSAAVESDAPGEVVLAVARDLATTGVHEASWLGVEGVDSGSGVQVASVVPGGPGDDAGLEAGDVVLAVGDQAVGSVDELRLLLQRWEPGERVDVVYRRNGRRALATAVLDVRPDHPNP